jgi:hypothetical protein
LPETSFDWAFSNCRSIPAIQVAGSDGLLLLAALHRIDRSASGIGEM